MIVERYNPFRTLDAKGWDNIQVYDYYDSPVSDGCVLVIFNGTDAQFKWADALKENSYIWDWAFGDSVAIDFEDNCAYDMPMTHDNVIYLPEGSVGRRVIEEEQVVWEDLEDYFIDDHEVMLPVWFPMEQLEAVGYKEISCDFSMSWYSSDNPEEIARELYDKGFTHVVFQEQRASGFCVWGTRD